MHLVADLHIHSHFSRATSKDLTLEHLARWAQLKGVHIVGSGDIAHPGWLAELRSRLEPAEEGLYRLRDDLSAAVQRQVPPACQRPVRFMLAGEISNIYKKAGATRKVHHILFAPDLDTLERLQARLERIGNIRADGRPILGLPSRDLLEIALTVNPRCHLIPAHIWTPWFALLGSKSGYDSVEQCFEDLTPHIFALETGLSSDPPMNWRVSALDRYTLVSNSDAHSPSKLAREATLFDCEPTYDALFDALRTGDPARFQGTVEFFPEEGKYHLDGHRACGVRWEPQETLAHGGLCSVCGKPVTVGVMHRVEQLADRPVGGRPLRTHPFYSLVPLPELLGEMLGTGPASKQVEAEYFRLLGRLGPELEILLTVPLEEIRAVGGERLAEGIGRMRRGEVEALGGYDGEYGVIRVFGGRPQAAGQMGLFGEEGTWGHEGRRGKEGAREAGGAGRTRGTQGNWAGAREERASYEAEVGPMAEGLPSVPAGSAQVDQGAAPMVDAKLTPEEPQRERDAPPAALDAAPEPAADLALPAAGVARPDVASPLPTADDFPRAAPAYPLSTPRSSLLLADLNPEQAAAVQAVDAPLVIVAGPGTGKTRTLTVRIAYLIQALGVPPEQILAITFTNKAAGEMAERLAALLGQEMAGRVTVKTFHALGAALLREHGGRLGLSPQFTILADEERRSLLKRLAPDLSQAELDQALALISAAKNQLLPADAPADSLSFPHFPRFPLAFRAYEAALRRADAVDFDDLVALTVRLLEAHPDVLAAVQARFRWISVDEYQDVNLAQYRLLRLLADGGANLCVIGDPDQAIYGFRGADRRYFLSFEQDFPAARRIVLRRNYRSTQAILDAAMQVIGRDGGQRPALEAVAALADFAEQVKLEVYTAPTDKAEAEYVVHQIEQMVGGTSYFSLDSGRVEGAATPAARSFADFAVLYRLAAQSRPLVEAFERSGIPYQTVGQAPLTAHRAVREALAWLWLLHNPRSAVHQDVVWRAAEVEGGKMGKEGNEGKEGKEGSLEELGELGGTWGSWEERLERAKGLPRLTAAQRCRVEAMAALWRELVQAREAGETAAQLLVRVQAWLGRHRAEPLSEADGERLAQLARRSLPFAADLPAFLEAMALQSETDAYDPRADRVALMTLHAAKGLEFPVVFIVGCEEGLLPYAQPDRPADVDEERRLFYVGVTRAQRRLFLVSARRRFLFGRSVENPSSRFVADIEAALKEVRAAQRRPSKPKPAAEQLSLF